MIFTPSTRRQLHGVAVWSFTARFSQRPRSREPDSLVDLGTGVVLAVGQVCRFLGGLVFGRVADKTGRFRGVLLGTNLISVALALATTSLVAPWHGMHGWKRVLVLALLADGYAFFTRPPVHKSSVVVGAPDSSVDSRAGHRRARS